jgi:hypothetical protein
VRYFCASPDVYLSICAQLDAAYGYPNTETKTERALPLLTELSTDAQGRVYLPILAEYCEYNLPSEMLPQLIAAGLVEEITAEQFAAVQPQTP